MQDILKRKKLLLCSVVFSSCIALSGCSFFKKEDDIGTRKLQQRGTVTDTILYYPRKLSNWLTASWDKHIAGVPPNWQKNMDLGEPRKPIYNPGGKMYHQQPDDHIIMLNQQPMYKAPSSGMGQSGYGVPSSPVMSAPKKGYGYETPQEGLGEARESFAPQPPAYVPPPSVAPVDNLEYKPLIPTPPAYAPMPAQDLPWQGSGAGQAPVPLAEGGDRKEEYIEGDVQIEKDGYVPAPVAPWEKGGDYMGMGQSGSGQSEYQPTYQGSGYEQPYGQPVYGQEDLSDTGGVVDPFEPGGFEGGFKPPSYDQLERQGGDPFAPAQNKYIRVFEPMTSEYYRDSSGNVVSKTRSENSFIPVPVVKKKLLSVL